MARARSGWRTASMAMPRLPMMSLSRAGSPSSRVIASAFSSDAIAPWASPSLKQDHAQVGERGRFLGAVAVRRAAARSCFGVLRADCLGRSLLLGRLAAGLARVESTPETRKRFGPSFWNALPCGPSRLDPASIERAALRLRARPGSGRFVARRIARRTRRWGAGSPAVPSARPSRSQSWPDDAPRMRCRARIEVAAVVHSPCSTVISPRATLRDAFPVLKARVAVGGQPEDEPASVRDRFRKDSLVESEASPIG